MIGPGVSGLFQPIPSKNTLGKLDLFQKLRMERFLCVSAPLPAISLTIIPLIKFGGFLCDLCVLLRLFGGAGSSVDAGVLIKFKSILPSAHGTQNPKSQSGRRSRHCRFKHPAGGGERAPAPGSRLCRGGRGGPAQRPGQRYLLRSRMQRQRGWPVDDHLRMERLAQRESVVDPKRLREGTIPRAGRVQGAVPAPGKSGPSQRRCRRVAALHARRQCARAQNLRAPGNEKLRLRGLRDGFRPGPEEKGTSMRKSFVLSSALLLAWATLAQSSDGLRETVRARVNQEYPALFELYKYFHANLELSFYEEKTAARVVEELKRAGYEVTSGVGKHG